jgi:hypothetical protein
MAIMDILLPFVSEPSGAAIAVIDKCMAMAGDLGARVTATAVEEDILVRPFQALVGASSRKGFVGQDTLQIHKAKFKGDPPAEWPLWLRWCC